MTREKKKKNLNRLVRVFDEFIETKKFKSASI